MAGKTTRARGAEGAMRRQSARGAGNVGVARGAWGETVATEYLRRRGFVIIDRNARPVGDDARLELDIVAWERKSDTMVFVEVKQHAALSPYASRLQAICRRKKANQLRACDAWRRSNRWRGAFRFDVIEIYGVPGGGAPVVDHIENVRLFAKSDRFVNWK
ncbi:MAG: YraN family protein [Kiritimatiellia bacterium]